MKSLLILLLICPLMSWAQFDTLPPVQRSSLKPIGSDLVPGGYYGGRYGYGYGGGRMQYTYDGLDVRRVMDLKLYIMASGDPDAIRELNGYIRNRHAGGWLIAGGSVAMIVGTAIALSNGPGSDGKYTMQQPLVCPVGYACGGNASNGGMVYGGQVYGHQAVTDTKRVSAGAAGFVTVLAGGILAGIGWGLNRPGQRVRRAVQYYNRSLKQSGVSWQVQPYSGWSSSGVGLTGQF